MLNTTVASSNGTDGQVPVDMQAYENDYLFDLLGYRVLEQAIAPHQLQLINDWIDAQPPRQPGDWVGNIHVHSYQGHDGTNYQNIVEGGEVFEEMMDNPPWYDAARRYIVNDFNGLAIQENFLNVREQGGYIGIHSGGHVPAAIFSFRHHTGAWNVGQINVLMALTDIGPGDGATVVVPGSHKSHMVHPAMLGGQQQIHRDDMPASEGLMTQEVHLKKGDALMFTDAITHGSSPRINPGQRRVMIYRYSPSSIKPRYNYVPSPEFLARLTPARRALIEAKSMLLPPGRTLA
jgi:hypothetical protein